MRKDDVDDLLAAALSGRQLLTHPFYRRWEAGALAPGELADYAGQYRHIEAAFPAVLGAALAALPAGPAHSLLAQTLHDELHPVPHVTLFEDFARAVGAPDPSPPSPATAALVDCYRAAAARGPVPALAAIGAYEVQSAAIAASKGEGLSGHYGIHGAGRQFWDLHAELDTQHADWTSQALAELPDLDGDLVIDVATAAATAWWDFLSEREAAAA
ncbi:MAG TPA: iron-containing redox enzyme family protein [Acidimicrobiales bacterium]